MPELVYDFPRQYLDLDPYIDDYNRVVEHLAEPIWKLERIQDFREPGFPSWEAFVEGRWEEAIRLYEATAGELHSYFFDLESRGVPFRRVRVVEKPIVPYLQWELTVLAIRYRCGEHIRVVTGDAIAALEAENGQLPEVLLLGVEVGYLVDYDSDGVARGAERFEDPEALGRYRAVIEDLYANGEELATYVQREVATLPPPTV